MNNPVNDSIICVFDSRLDNNEEEAMYIPASPAYDPDLSNNSEAGDENDAIERDADENDAERAMYTPASPAYDPDLSNNSEASDENEVEENGADESVVSGQFDDADESTVESELSLELSQISMIESNGTAIDMSIDSYVSLSDVTHITVSDIVGEQDSYIYLD